jgi:copper chaperone
VEKIINTKIINMETLKFKTNIKCSGCVASVTEPLNAAAGEGNWQVDLTSADKTLVITNPKIQGQQIIAAVEKAGYKAEEVGN